MVLAAGLGTRLRPITAAMPKPMVPVLNRPVMEHIVELLARHGFVETIANLHWFPELVEAHFGDGSRFGVELTYSRERRLLGTSGGVRNAAEFLGESFLVISGDALTDIDLGAMRDFHQSHQGIATLATKRVTDTTQFGVAITGADQRIGGFQEKPDPAEALSDLANCGIYMFRSEIFDFFPEPGASRAAAPTDAPGFADWAMDVFPALLESDVPFYSHEIEAYWNDIGNLDELRGGNFDALAGRVELGSRGTAGQRGNPLGLAALRHRGLRTGADRSRGQAGGGGEDRGSGDPRRWRPDRSRRRAPRCAPFARRRAICGFASDRRDRRPHRRSLATPPRGSRIG